MRDLNSYYFFVQVTDQRGFAAAGRALEVPKSTLSRRIIDLESRLGARLIQRTSRSFKLTEAGREFYEHALAMLIEAEAAENSVKRRMAEPSGLVRFTCSIGMAPPLAELLARFLTTFPKVSLVQHATNRYVDLVEEGFDVGLRGHFQPLPDSGMIQRRLSPTPWHLFAAPGYLGRAGTPVNPADLVCHSAIALGTRSDETLWKLRTASGEEVVIPFTPRMCSDDLETLKLAAIANLGVAALPEYVCRKEIEQGKLLRVLPAWSARSEAEVTLLAPSRRGLLPSVRAFIDFLAAEFPALVSGKH
ncbi:MAG: LysR substrate-binding domain-containing protein [Steroidobacteraceae bacterium]